MCGATLILCVICLCLKLMLHGVTAMMAYMCSVARKYALVSASRRCCVTPGFSMISCNNYEYMFDSGSARGHCWVRSVHGSLCIFGDVRVHALCEHVWNRVRKRCFIVVSLLFVRPHMYM